MDGILQFLETIASFIGTLTDLAVTFVSNIFSIADILTKFVLTLPTFFVWLPGTIVSLIAIMISIAVVMRILGR